MSEKTTEHWSEELYIKRCNVYAEALAEKVFLTVDGLYKEFNRWEGYLNLDDNNYYKYWREYVSQVYDEIEPIQFKCGNIKIEKPSFEDIYSYLNFYYKKDALFGDEAVKVLKNQAKKLINPELIEELDLPEKSLLLNDNFNAINTINKIAERCGGVSKKSITTLSSSNARVDFLSEKISEGILSLLNKRKNLDFNSELDEATLIALKNKRTPRVILIKTIEALLKKDWQIDMLETFSDYLNRVACQKIENSRIDIKKEIQENSNGLKRVNRLKDELSA